MALTDQKSLFLMLEIEPTLLFSKCWRRHWVVLDVISSSSCHSCSPSNANNANGNTNGRGESNGDHVEAALVARIYSNHLHEGRSLPYSTVTINDVHALHRTQSRFVLALALGLPIYNISDPVYSYSM